MSREAAASRGRSIGDPAVLRYVLRDELRAGRVEFDEATGLYWLNGGLPADVQQAFRDLEL
jgi:hypothetical protein